MELLFQILPQHDTEQKVLGRNYVYIAAYERLAVIIFKLVHSMAYIYIYIYIHCTYAYTTTMLTFEWIEWIMFKYCTGIVEIRLM